MIMEQIILKKPFLAKIMRINTWMEKVLRYFISTLNLISKIVTHLNACFCFFLNVSDKVKRKGKALEMIQNNSK